MGPVDGRRLLRLVGTLLLLGSAVAISGLDPEVAPARDVELTMPWPRGPGHQDGRLAVGDIRPCDGSGLTVPIGQKPLDRDAAGLSFAVLGALLFLAGARPTSEVRPRGPSHPRLGRWRRRLTRRTA